MFEVSVAGQELYRILWFFFIFCFFGVLVEMLYCFMRSGVIESRVGLLYLPLSPIYGLGGVFLGVYLLPYLNQPFLLFVMAVILGSVLEYFGSWFMEKFFHAVFWDYSNKPFNLHGRICLEYSIYWGFLGGILMYVIVPPIDQMVNSIPRPPGDEVLMVLCVLTAISIWLTLSAFTVYSKNVAALQAKAKGGDGTFPRTGYQKLIKTLVPDSVMINTYPRMSTMVTYQQLTGHWRTWIQVGAKPPDSSGKSHGLQITVTKGPKPPIPSPTDVSPTEKAAAAANNATADTPQTAKPPAD